MPKIKQSAAPADDASPPGIEPWFVVCLLAFVPGALIVILPRATLAPLLVPICATMIAFIVAGLVLLWRTERARRRREARTREGTGAATDGLELR